MLPSLSKREKIRKLSENQGSLEYVIRSKNKMRQSKIKEEIHQFLIVGLYLKAIMTLLFFKSKS